MAAQGTSFEQLKAFLNELFQFESSDLDFGIYRILHFKRAEIGRFVNETLPRKVQEQLETLSEAETANLADQIADLEKKDTIKGWISAPAEARPTLEQYGNGTIAEYKRLKQLEANMRATEVSENDIYNHLRIFFSRYYDKGDFVSKRRYGKNEKYVVPYNGEETFFHWANRDQYYIKSAENFKSYSFRIATQSGSMALHFRLTEAEIPQGNVKADEARYFILSSERSPDVTETDTTLYFEYRALTAEEKVSIKGNSKQDTLNEEAVDTLKAAYVSNPLLQPLWQATSSKKEGESTGLLLNKLNHYTRKNSYDFFIHKDLGGFLARELDFYIKTELVKVDDLYVTETDAHYERLRLSLRKIKAFKAIAETIIDLLAQIENFQKKLWEKKKFVVATEWVITVDRLMQYVGEEAARALLEEVVKNDEQVAEWRSLYGEDIVPRGKLTVDSLKQKDGSLLKVAVDTKHFKTADVKTRLLHLVSEKLEIEEVANGLLVESDNYHGLQLLSSKFEGQLNTIYIDPPYNSGSNDFLYKDSFRNSSWLSMLTDRVTIAREFLSEDGLFFTSIDDKDDTNKVVHQLSNLLESIFGKENYIENVIWVKNTTHNDAKTFSHNHEYIQAYTKNKEVAVQEHDMFRRAKPGYTEVKELIHRLNEDYPKIEEISKQLRELYRKQQEEYKKEVELLGLPWNDEIKRNNPWKGVKLYYWADYRLPDGTYVPENDAKKKKAQIWVYAEDNPSWPNANTLTDDHRNPEHPEYRFYRPIHPITGEQCSAPERGWIWKEKSVDGSKSLSFEALHQKNMIHFGEDEKKIPRTKRFLDNVSSDVVKSVISDFKDGEKQVSNLIGARGTFPNPKPTSIIQTLLSLSSKRSGYVMDFFAGSGTTANSAFLLNDVEERQLKFILHDMAQNVHNTILPRIKKLAYSFNWEDGKPKNGSMNGLGVLFKYQRLEQYEEALENIAFRANPDAVQQALELDDYIPKYFLNFETQGSQTLVNLQAMEDPFDYKLKVWDGYTYDNEQAVDLIETFLYLHGLHLCKQITKERDGRKYVFVLGRTNEDKRTLSVWRSVKGWELADFEADGQWLKDELAIWEYDELVVNGKALLPDGLRYDLTVEEVFTAKMFG